MRTPRTHLYRNFCESELVQPNKEKENLFVNLFSIKTTFKCNTWASFSLSHTRPPPPVQCALNALFAFSIVPRRGIHGNSTEHTIHISFHFLHFLLPPPSQPPMLLRPLFLFSSVSHAVFRCVGFCFSVASHHLLVNKYRWNFLPKQNPLASAWLFNWLYYWICCNPSLAFILHSLSLSLVAWAIIQCWCVV